MASAVRLYLFVIAIVDTGRRIPMDALPLDRHQTGTQDRITKKVHAEQVNLSG